MTRLDPRAFVTAAGRYIKEHPEELVRAARSALGLRLSIPLDAMRFVARQVLTSKRAPQDLLLECRPPGLRMGATVRQMGATIRAESTLYIDKLSIAADACLVTCRIDGLATQVLDGEDSPLGGLLRSGTLDLSRPGKFVEMMPKRPPFIIEVTDDTLEIDLMKVPALAKNTRLSQALAVLSPVVQIESIRTKDDHLEIQFRASPSRAVEAVEALRSVC